MFDENINQFYSKPFSPLEKASGHFSADSTFIKKSPYKEDDGDDAWIFYIQALHRF